MFSLFLVKDILRFNYLIIGSQKIILITTDLSSILIKVESIVKYQNTFETTHYNSEATKVK